MAVLAGARSTEHEVSLVSAYNIAKAIDRNKYDVYVVGIVKMACGVVLPYSQDDFVDNPTSVGTARLSPRPISGRLAVTQCSNQFYDIDNGGAVAFGCDVIISGGTQQLCGRRYLAGFAAHDGCTVYDSRRAYSAVGMDKGWPIA